MSDSRHFEKLQIIPQQQFDQLVQNLAW